MESKYTNALIHASSPYLQQHAHNPVNWVEWGIEALDSAEKEGKPLLISIGYSACHWCHVMARESYMDETVAEFMNTHFIPIKVDREERPDLDQIYIEAAQLLNGNAGWPLNVFALPDGRPFFAGTYFPKEDWLNVLRQLDKVYREEPNKVEEQAKNLTEGISGDLLSRFQTSDKTVIERSAYNALFEHWNEQIDFQKGGLKGAPKFPMPTNWDFLLQYYHFTGNIKALGAINTTLRAMAQGGIYDQIGGGFARYSTDTDWFAPHFEKMLYDNAQLVSIYAKAYQVTGNQAYEKVVKETLNFVERELMGPEGEFYASLNAESEGEEGKYYVWTGAEIEDVFEEEEKVALFKAYYNIIPEGNWENENNILFRTKNDEDFAKMIGLPNSMVQINIHAANKKLLKKREEREKPSTDDKVLVSWNALMIKAYIDAYRALSRDIYLETALKNAHFILEKMRNPEGGLYRNYKNKSADIDAFLDDYAFLADALVGLYQVTFNRQWLQEAQQLVDDVLAHFYDSKDGMFFYTSDREKGLIARKKIFTDNEMPSSNATMAKVLWELGRLLDKKDYKKIGEGMVKKMWTLIQKNGTYFAAWSSVLGEMLYSNYEVAVVGDKALEKTAQMQQRYLPGVMFMGGDHEDLPLLTDKKIEGKTLIYVCRDKVCQLPVEEVALALKQLHGTKQ